MPSVLTAVLNVLCFDFFFVPPRFTFAVSDVQYLLTFGVMLTVALVIATLMASVRQQTRVAGARERRTALLYAMSRELARTRDSASMARVAVKHVAEVFQCQRWCCCRTATGRASVSARAADGRARIAAPISQLRSGSPITAGAQVWAPTRCRRRRRSICRSATAARPRRARRAAEQRRRVLLPEQRHLLETFAGQIGARGRAREARRRRRPSARVAAEARELAQHAARVDLPRPAHAARGDGRRRQRRWSRARAALDEATRAQLARSIETKAREMSELVSKVLDLMRLDSGEIALRRDWQAVEDLVGAALQQNDERLREHPVDIRCPGELPPVYVDPTLDRAGVRQPIRQRREVHAAPAR